MANVQDSDLIATGAGQGAAMVGFKQSGTGVVNRTVLPKLRECVSVLDFGAVGDGTTDDTAAIQAAIDSLGATGHLLIPEGTYRITDTLEIKPTIEWAGIHLFGRGPASKIVWDGGNNKPMIHIRGDGTLGLGFNSKSIIENFQLFGESFSGYGLEGYEIPADDFSGVVGIQIGDTSPENAYSGVCNLTIRGMLIRNIGTGILGFYESDEVSICENHIKLFSEYGIRNQHGGSAWWVYRNHVSDGSETATGIRMSLVACVVEANTIQGLGYSVGIQVDGGSDDYGKAVSVRNNYLESGYAGDYGVILYGVDTGIIENNSFHGFRGSTLIVLADAADSGTSSCNNITIGANRHTMNVSDVNALVAATSGSTNCQIIAEQATDGGVTTISGPFIFKCFDGVAEVSQGIKFPATQNPSSNPNTLDDYEEGFVTLGISVGGAAQTTTSVARYTKIGRLVTVTGYVAMAAAVSGTGGVSVTGLPFATSGGAAASMSVGNVTYTGTPSLLLISGSELLLMYTDGTGMRSALTHTALASNSEIELTLTYTTAA